MIDVSTENDNDTSMTKRADKAVLHDYFVDMERKPLKKANHIISHKKQRIRP